MLPLKNRLKKNRDFQKILKTGKKYFSGGILLKVASNNLNQTRVGFIISAKFAKKAAERNKIKRTLREQMRRELAGIQTGLDLLVIPLKKGAGKTEREKLAQDAVVAIGKGGLGKGNKKLFK